MDAGKFIPTIRTGGTPTVRHARKNSVSKIAHDAPLKASAMIAMDMVPARDLLKSNWRKADGPAVAGVLGHGAFQIKDIDKQSKLP